MGRPPEGLASLELSTIDTIEIRDGSSAWRAAAALLDTGNRHMTVVDEAYAVEHGIYSGPLEEGCSLERKDGLPCGESCRARKFTHRSSRCGFGSAGSSRPCVPQSVSWATSRSSLGWTCFRRCSPLDLACATNVFLQVLALRSSCSTATGPVPVPVPV